MSLQEPNTYVASLRSACLKGVRAYTVKMIHNYERSSRRSYGLAPAVTASRSVNSARANQHSRPHLPPRAARIVTKDALRVGITDVARERPRACPVIKALLGAGQRARSTGVQCCPLAPSPTEGSAKGAGGVTPAGLPL
jgi:hypothetical protein